jgi:hypothetical protein
MLSELTLGPVLRRVCPGFRRRERTLRVATNTPYCRPSDAGCCLACGDCDFFFQSVRPWPGPVDRRARVN